MSVAERLRASLVLPPPADLLAMEADLLPGEFRDAAVLVAVTDRPEPGVLLTTRRADLRAHPGQVAFPGGKVDRWDADATAAALREAEEEIALPASAVEVWGTADPFRTGTGFHITPVLGLVPADLPLVPHEGEVADWFEPPLAFVLDPANQREEEAMFRGKLRRYHVIEWEGRRIWGVTAALIVNLSRRMGWR
ncbi:CoA pyrophosphatase [Sphingomonas ginkgonis]|uniref:CoA pyrophosphatase n=1 Tax=Sphingomonas ginkgonis TaxID=2315330 RepID=A0A3R9YN96_9SPHN|nr:CoA pyrophosphatase [Sphingomonas ginkgonis]RST31678.1 CoA pyrophosphatase [Sphingomonas ginkgonis]